MEPLLTLRIGIIEDLKKYHNAPIFKQVNKINELKKLDSRGVVATAVEGDGFVSRCFFPKLNVNEAPVTGSAHCQLAPLWSKRLNKTRVIGEQLSSRGGRVICEVEQDRVKLFGQAVEYLRGTITI